MYVVIIINIFNIETAIESIYLDFTISSIEESSELVNFLFQLRLVLPALLSAHLVGIVGDIISILLGHLVRMDVDAAEADFPRRA